MCKVARCTSVWYWKCCNSCRNTIFRIKKSRFWNHSYKMRICLFKTYVIILTCHIKISWLRILILVCMSCEPHCWLSAFSLLLLSVHLSSNFLSTNLILRYIFYISIFWSHPSRLNFIMQFAVKGTNLPLDFLIVIP